MSLEDGGFEEGFLGDTPVPLEEKEVSLGLIDRDALRLAIENARESEED